MDTNRSKYRDTLRDYGDDGGDEKMLRTGVEKDRKQVRMVVEDFGSKPCCFG